MDQKRYDIGMAKRRQVLGDAYVDRAMQNVDDFNRDFQRILTEYCWGETWGDETLKPRERSILNLGMIGGARQDGRIPDPCARRAQQRPDAERDPRGADADHDLLRRAGRRRLLSVTPSRSSPNYEKNKK